MRAAWLDRWARGPPTWPGTAGRRTRRLAPGRLVLANGAYIIYNITYPISPRINVRGSVAFGSRDGPGSFGGGVGTSVAF